MSFLHNNSAHFLFNPIRKCCYDWHLAVEIEVNWIICSSQFYLYFNVLKYFFFTFPLFISLSPWRIYRRICFKWADNTLFKIYKYDRIISFFLTTPDYANKLVLNYLALAIHRTNIGKDHLVKVYLEQNFNCSSETLREQELSYQPGNLTPLPGFSF